MKLIQSPGWRLQLACLLLCLTTQTWAAAGDVSQVFTLEGELYDSPTGDTPYEGGATIKVRILDSTKNCTLYAETQHVDTTSSSGVFNIEIGSIVGDGKRIAGVDSGHTMAKVFQNLDPIAATGGGCGGTYTPAPAGGQGRYLRISVTPDAGSEDVLGPDMYVGSVPTAIVSQTLQGIGPDGFLQLGTVTELTQANLENVFSDTNYPILEGLLAGVTGNADDVGVNSANGSLLLQTNGTTRAEITNAGDFKVDGSTFVVDAANNRIGMGTGTPSFDFSFAGTAAKTLGMERSTVAGSELAVSAGGAVAGGTNLNGGNLFLKSGISTGTGGSNIYLQTATPAGSSGSADNAPSTKMTVLGNGNVGIGTTSPSALLNVYQGASAHTALAGGTFNIYSNNAGASIFNVTGYSTAPLLNINQNGTSVIHALANGNVGIGTTTPVTRLDVSGPTAASFTGTSLLGAATKVAGVNNHAGLDFINEGRSTVNPIARIAMITDGTGSYLKFGTSNDWASGGITNTAMTIDPSGRVGIGIAAPVQPLDVTGNARVSGTLFINALSRGTSAGNLALVSDLVSGNGGEIHLNGSTKAVDPGVLIFRTGAGANAERMRIDTSGNVGIGTTVPLRPLHISSTNSATIVLERPDAGVDLKKRYVSNNSSGSLTFGKFSDDMTSTTHILIDSSGNVGIGTITPAEKLEVNGNVKATAFLYTSDRRLKTDIHPLENSLEKVTQLQGVQFNWKASGETAIGFIAQDVERVAPELVRTDEKSTLKSVQYGNIVALIVEAIRELRESFDHKWSSHDRSIASLEMQNENLQKKLKVLSSENEKLENRLQDLETRMSRFEEAQGANSR